MNTDDLPLQLHFARTVAPPSDGPSPYGTMLAWLDERLGPAGPTGQQDKVLVLGHPGDEQHERVVLELLRRGVPVCRFHPAEFARNTRLTLRLEPHGEVDGMLALPLASLPLHEVRSVWYRHPQLPPTEAIQRGLVPGKSAADSFTELAIGGALTALFDLLQNAFWVSHPQAIRAAASPLDMLQRAARAGLRIPRTILTNDPQLARAFFDECGGKIVVKALHRWWCPTAEGIQHIASGIVKHNEVGILERVQVAPCLLQEHLAADITVSVVVFGQQVFAAACPLSEESSGHWEPYSLPGDVESASIEIVRGYGLQSGVLHLVRDSSGEHIALRLDADGEWLELEEQTGLPLVRSMADLLEAGRTE